MRRVRYWWLRVRLATARWTARWPRAPKRALRNVLVLWTIIVGAVGLAAWTRLRPDGPHVLATVTAQRWHEAMDNAVAVLPRMDDFAPAERELGAVALQMALPLAMSHDDGARASAPWTRVVRQIVHVMTGTDVGDPAAMLAFALPAFENYLDLAVDGGLPLSTRAMGPQGTRASRPPSSVPSPDVSSKSPSPSPAPSTSPSAAGEPPSAAGEPPSLAGEPSSAATERPGRQQPSAMTEPPLEVLDAPLERLRDVAWGDACRVLIYHTHTSEMYRTDTFAPSNPDEYHRFNTADTGIVAVGAAIANHLEDVGIPTCHSKATHDWPSHPRAYIEARTTVEQLLERHQHVDIVLDVHRDAPSDLVTTVGGRRAAQIAFVIGTHSRMHPGWPENVAFARAMADLLEERFPGLFRRIIERPDARLNQDLHPRAILVEIGSYDSYLDEALVSAELFAEVVADMLHIVQFGRSAMERTPR